MDSNEGGSVGTGEQVSRMGELRNGYRILVRKPKAHIEIGKPGGKRENHKEMAFKEI
jgi:hypothetical protein